MEMFGWPGWKREPKLIHLLTKLLTEVLSCSLPLLHNICILKLPKFKRSRWGVCNTLSLLCLRSMLDERLSDICLL